MNVTLHGKGELKKQMELKLLSAAFKTGHVLDYPGGPNVIMGVLKCERGRQMSQSRMWT